jgi:hypothetical protein
MTAEQDFLDSMVAEIEIAKDQHRNGVFKIRQKLTDSQATFVKNQLPIRYPQYRIEIRKCPACAFEWDIMVIF